MSTPQYTEIEQKLGSPLAQLVGERRTAGISWRKIAVEITARTGVDVTGETLRVWHVGIAPRRLTEVEVAGLRSQLRTAHDGAA